jgi:hypothetical protein
MKVRLELTLAEADALYHEASEFFMSDATEFINNRGKRAYSTLSSALAKLNLAKQCFTFHRQVKEGRDMHGAQSVGVQDDGAGGQLELYNCPYCHSSISRKVKP